MKKNILILSAIAFFIVSSCKKKMDEQIPETKTPVVTKTDLISAKAWKLTAVTVSPGIFLQGGPLITDFYPYIENCKKDDNQRFNLGGKGIIDEGASKCNPEDPQTEEFSWAFANNETKLILDEDTSTIVQLDSNTLKLSTAVEGSEVGGEHGRIYTFLRTFKNN
ncbi:MAG: hypothetical protein Q8R57_14700 [Bacteroidota bacterium]|nr:hypothetical protein [Bacteroidota bacterium]